MTRFRGLSPIIATAILIAAAIAVGYVIWNYVVSGTTAVAQKPQLIISVMTDYVGSTAYIELSIKNTGGAAANITGVAIDGNDVSSQLFTGYYLLRPGQELHKVVTINNLPSGDHIIIVTLADGSQFKAKFVS